MPRRHEADAIGVRAGDAVTIVAHDVGGVGGMERQLEALITELLGRGTRVTVVSRTLRLPPQVRLRWHRVRGPARPFSVAYPWFAVAATLMLTRCRKGLLHTTGAIVLNRADVCTVHYLHHGRSASLRRMSHATALYRLNAAAARTLSRAGERIVYSSPARSKTLVAVSDALARDLLDAFPGRAEAIWVIGNGVDLDRFRPDEAARRKVRDAFELSEADRVALFVGSEWRRKGAGIAVEALVEAPSWHLAVVGRGDAAELSAQALRLGVLSRLHLVAASDEPECYYAAADAFVLPSAYESFSLAAFEAAASGLPVVATEVGAVSEIVNAGGGLFVERDASSLGAALRTLEEDAAARAVMGERARSSARRFRWDAVVDEYVNLYRTSGDAAPRAVAGSAAG